MDESSWLTDCPVLLLRWNNSSIMQRPDLWSDTFRPIIDVSWNSGNDWLTNFGCEWLYLFEGIEDD